MADMTMNFGFILIILLQIKRIESLFVSVGDYSNEWIPGLNAPECGLNIKPILIELPPNNKCFQRKFDKTLVFFDKLKVKPQINQRVYKGEDVKHAYESPWVVFIGTTHWFSDAGTCTGVLITPYWVLTAAHCFLDLRDKWMVGVWLTIGSNTRKGIKRIDIKKDSFYLHPGYGDPIIQSGYVKTDNHTIAANDIALVKISGFFPETTHDNKYFINTICLPNRDEVNEVRELASFYGYGGSDRGTPEYLQKGWVILKPHRACTYYRYFCGNFTDYNPRPCGGDSGGPLVQFIPGIENRAVLLGTLSTTSPAETHCTWRTKHANWIPVSKHIDWILKTMKENYP